MRLIGHITGETQAHLFSDYLSSMEIKSSVEPDADNKWAIWIYSEDQVEAGKQHLAEYLAHPSDPKYAVGARQGEKVQEREREAEAKLGERVFTRETIFRSNASVGAVTLALILICVALSIYTGFSRQFSVVFPKLHSLFISEYISRQLPEVRHGEIWRLLTPIFIHFGPIHLIFNMLMLKDLGTMIEVRQGVWTLLVLVVLVAVPSNLAELFYTGPTFGGMSGVLYGLFGYIWMRQRWDPGSGLYLSQQSVASMLIWFVLCAAHVLPVNIANAAHAGGLAAGIIFGAVPMLWNRRS